MPRFDIVKHSELKDSYRVQSVIGAFDLDVKKLDEHFTGNIDIEGKEWNVGLIVGGSGTGKTTIAREIFGDCIYAGMPHSGGQLLTICRQVAAYRRLKGCSRRWGLRHRLTGYALIRS